MNTDSDVLLQQAYEAWQQAMLKAAKTDDENVFVWTDYEGLTYRHLPPPVDVDVSLPHMDAFHNYWVMQKQTPGFGIASYHHERIQRYMDDFIQLYWLDSDTKKEQFTGSKAWHILNDPSLINTSAINVINPYINAISNGTKADPKQSQKFLAQNEFDYILIDAASFHNCGASPTWEIALALSMADELVSLVDNKAALAQKMLISSGVGVMQLLEIAKLRALRFGIYNLLGAYMEHAPFTPIIASTSGTYFSHQVNIALLLKEEAHLDKVIDPYAGSYYLEQQTDTLAKKAWEHYLEIKAAGGFSEALNAGIIQREVKSYREKLHDLFRLNQITGIGINKYQSSFAKSVPQPAAATAASTEIEVLTPFNLFA